MFISLKFIINPNIPHYRNEHIMHLSQVGTGCSLTVYGSCLLAVVFLMLNKKSSLKFKMSSVPCYTVGFSVIAVTGPCLLGVVFVLEK
jgi:hypothetical protein